MNDISTQKLPLVILPDKRLRIVSDPITAVNSFVLRLLDNMVETMYAEEGIGLAAVQVGYNLRAVVIDITQKQGIFETQFFINPEVLLLSEELITYKEGCLSIPDCAEDVVRPSYVKVKYLDRQGKTQILEADGLLARCLQHEIDHLNGILFIDHLSRLKRERIVKRVLKYSH